MDNRDRGLIKILLIIIVVLLLIMLYAFVIKPAMNGYVVKKQTVAYAQANADIWNGMLMQLNQNGYVQFSVGNQTLILVPYSK
mgnify:CR=1 FL=1